MWSTLRRISHFFDQTNETVGKGVAWLTTILMIVVCADVVVRYLFRTTAIWVTEVEWHLFALIFILGAGYAFKHDRHVRVDLFYSKFSLRDKAWVNLVGGLVFLIPWTLLIAYVSYKYAMVSFLIRETSPNPGGLPALYFIKFSMVVGLLLLFLQAVSSIIQSLLVLRPKEALNEQNENN